MMRFELTLGAGVVTFTPINSDGPYPYLAGVGRVSVAARAGSSTGFGAVESPTATVSLQNPDGRVAEIIGSPLRVPAALYDEDDRVFAGFVYRIKYGLTLVLTLKS